jgi:hypothetical protein
LLFCRRWIEGKARRQNRNIVSSCDKARRPQGTGEGPLFFESGCEISIETKGKSMFSWQNDRIDFDQRQLLGASADFPETRDGARRL